MDTELHVQDIVTVPFIIWVIGLVIWFIAAAGRRQGKGGGWKWILAYVVIAFSAYATWSGLGSDPNRDLGFGNFVGDSIVRTEYDTSKLVFFLCASFFGPIVTIPILLFIDRREARRMADLVS